MSAHSKCNKGIIVMIFSRWNNADVQMNTCGNTFVKYVIIITEIFFNVFLYRIPIGLAIHFDWFFRKIPLTIAHQFLRFWIVRL